MKPVVCVVNDFMGVAYMWQQAGFPVVDENEIAKAALIQFTGGEDISPELYEEKPAKYTYWSDSRDVEEVEAYEFGRTHDIPMAGICRGGQLLNVLNGGKLLQHVEGHGGAHHTTDIFNNTYISSSIHHQMMIRPPDSELIAWTRLGCDKFSVDENGEYIPFKCDVDPEAIYFPELNHFCIQGHPEIDVPRYAKMREMYFFYLKSLVGFPE